jgi:hypothetical protein
LGRGFLGMRRGIRHRAAGLVAATAAMEPRLHSGGRLLTAVVAAVVLAVFDLAITSGVVALHGSFSRDRSIARDTMRSRVWEPGSSDRLFFPRAIRYETPRPFRVNRTRPWTPPKPELLKSQWPTRRHPSCSLIYTATGGLACRGR